MCFDEAFVKGLPKEFPEKVKMINDKLDALMDSVRNDGRSLRTTYSDLLACADLLEIIEKHHVFPLSAPAMSDEHEYFKDDKPRDAEDVAAWIQSRVDCMEECVSDLIAKAEKKKKEEEKEANDKSLRDAYEESLDGDPKDEKL